MKQLKILVPLILLGILAQSQTPGVPLDIATWYRYRQLTITAVILGSDTSSTAQYGSLVLKQKKFYYRDSVCHCWIKILGDSSGSSGPGGGATNLGIGTASNRGILITNDNGTGIFLDSATAARAGILTARDKAYLDSLHRGLKKDSVRIGGSIRHYTAINGKDSLALAGDLYAPPPGRVYATDPSTGSLGWFPNVAFDSTANGEFHSDGWNRLHYQAINGTQPGDTSVIWLRKMFPQIRGNDSTFNNGPYIQAAINLGSSIHRRVLDYSGDTLWTTQQLQAKSHTSLEGVITKAKFASSRYLMGNSDFATNELTDFHLIDCTIDGRGQNTDHRVLFSNTRNLVVSYCNFLDNDSTVLGGALGISAFNAYASFRSYNVTVDHCYFSGAGNFGVQLGNVVGYDISYLRFFRCLRELVGLEAYNLGGEGGVVWHGSVSHIRWNTPANTQVNNINTGNPIGSLTGSFIETTSSKGDVYDADISDVIGVGGLSHGLGVYGGRNIRWRNISIDSTKGYGANFQASNYDSNENLQVDHLVVSNSGTDGTHPAGIQIKDTKDADFSYITAIGNPTGIIENGYSERNSIVHYRSKNNTTALTRNTGRTHPSTYYDVWVDTAGTATSDLITYISNLGAQINASPNGSALVTKHWVDSVLSLISGGGAGLSDSSLTGYKMTTDPSTGDTVGFALRTHGLGYLKPIVYPYKSGSTGTWDQVMTNGHDSILNSHFINFGAGGGIVFASSISNPVSIYDLAAPGLSFGNSQCSGSGPCSLNAGNSYVAVTAGVNAYQINLASTNMPGNLLIIQKVDASSNSVILHPGSGKKINNSTSDVTLGTTAGATILLIDPLGDGNYVGKIL